MNTKHIISGQALVERQIRRSRRAYYDNFRKQVMRDPRLKGKRGFIGFRYYVPGLATNAEQDRITGRDMPEKYWPEVRSTPSHPFPGRNYRSGIVLTQRPHYDHYQRALRPSRSIYNNHR